MAAKRPSRQRTAKARELEVGNVFLLPGCQCRCLVESRGENYISAKRVKHCNKEPWCEAPGAIVQAKEWVVILEDGGTECRDQRDRSEKSSTKVRQSSTKSRSSSSSGSGRRGTGR